MTWSEIWNLPYWGFISFVITLAITIYIFREQRTIKRLSYKYFTIDSLIDIDDTVSNLLEITFRNTKITEMSLMELQFYNSGKVPIEKEDFVDDIKLIFPLDTIIYEVNLGDKKFNSIAIDYSYSFDEKVLSIKPSLLNSGDFFILRIFHGNISADKVKMTSRIKGVSKIALATEGFFGQGNAWLRWAVFMSFYAIIQFGPFIYKLMLNNFIIDFKTDAVNIILLIICIVSVVFVIIREKFIKSKIHDFNY